MDEQTFRALALSEWEAMPEKFKNRVKNVALIVEDEPSATVRKEEHLKQGDTLLGLYHGIPMTERGSHYGVGPTLPDTITLYRLPILEEAMERTLNRAEGAVGRTPVETGVLADTNTNQLKDAVRTVVRETIWHEVGHYFGFDEGSVREREDEGTNRFT